MRKFHFDAWAILIAVILIVASLWVVLLHFQRRSEIRNLDPFALIPSDAWLVLDLKDAEDIAAFFLSDSLTWEELKSLHEFSSLKDQLRLLDSLTSCNEEWQTAIIDSRVVVSVHTSVRGESPVLVQLRFNPDISPRHLRRLFKGRWQEGLGEQAYEFLGNSVFHFKPSEGKSLYAAFYKASLLLSPGKRMIEHAITQDISGSALLSAAELQSIRDLTGMRGNKVFFDGGRLCEFLEMILDGPIPSLMPCETFSGWMGWDFALLGEEIRLTGFALAGGDSTGFERLFPGGGPSEPFLMHYIPTASAAFAILNMDKNAVWRDSLEAFLFHHGDEGSIDSLARERLYPFLGHSLASVMLYGREMSPEEGSIALIHVSKPRELWGLMNEAGVWEEQETSLIPRDTVFDHVIWQFFPSGLMKALSLGMMPFEKPFVALLDSVLLAGASPQAVKQALMQIHYGQVVGEENKLSEDFIFQQPESDLLYSLNIPYLADMLKEKWQPVIQPFFDQIGDGAYPFNRLTAQFSSHRGGVSFSNISLHSDSDAGAGLHKQIWEVKLDTTAHLAPFCVVNHVDGSREVVLQDISGNFFLIDRFGQILWKRKIDGLVNSQVYQVDRYKNGKLQYLFSTPSHLHLIDRNGNDVEGYPIRLRVSAPHGITVVDFDGDRNYRIFFSGKDLRIHNVDIAGNRVGGWLRPVLEGPAANALQYLKLGSRDYLLVVDENGKPYFFDRRGQLRLSIPRAFRLATQSPVFSMQNNGKFFLVALGKDGSVLQLDEDGMVESFIPDSLAAGAGFLLLDTGEGKDPAYVFANGGELRAFDRLGKSLFSHQLSGKASLPMRLINSGSGHFIAITDEDFQQIYLFDENGKLIPPFPLPGNKGLCLESLLQDHSWNVITVHNDRLVVYPFGGI